MKISIEKRYLFSLHRHFRSQNDSFKTEVTYIRYDVNAGEKAKGFKPEMTFFAERHFR